MKKFGLIGYPLGHSFSKKYFTEKFHQLGLDGHVYDLFEMPDISLFLKVWDDLEVCGVNVTVPHKQSVKPFLSRLDPSAEKVGAVNVIKRVGTELIGYNSDYYGFKSSLENWLPNTSLKALVLGTGGSSKAVKAALADLQIPFEMVSRRRAEGTLTYDDLNEDETVFEAFKLIINTTPLGMHPNVTGKAELPYQALDGSCFLYDLVYNPDMTAFMQAGYERGASVKNGLEMLQLQAEKSWDIWTAK